MCVTVVVHVEFMYKYFRTPGLFKPLGTLGLLLRWLVHLVLHCIDEAQLGWNSCLQLHFWHQLLKFHVHLCVKSKYRLGESLHSFFFYWKAVFAMVVIITGKCLYYAITILFILYSGEADTWALSDWWWWPHKLSRYCKYIHTCSLVTRLPNLFSISQEQTGKTGNGNGPGNEAIYTWLWLIMCNVSN